MKKSIVAISFLFVLFAPAVTMFFYLHFQKASIKREIKWKMIAGMDQDELVLLKFSKEEINTKLRWEHSKEFEYNGQMYDVVSKEIKGDSIYYRCWWDHDETALNKKLQILVADSFDSNNENRDNQKQLYNYFHSFFCSELFEWKVVPTFALSAIYQDNLCVNNFFSIRLSPPTPPPQLS